MTASTAFLDQVDAAAREARNILDRAAAGTGLQRSDVRPGPFVTRLLEHVIRDARKRRLRACRHLQNSPGTSWVFAWRPSKLWCTRCSATVLGQVRGTDEDHRCDQCRRRAEELWTGLIAAGPFVLVLGLCRPCWTAETGEAAA